MAAGALVALAALGSGRAAQAVLARQPFIQAQPATTFTLRGIVQQLSAETWLVEGYLLSVRSASVSGAPAVGAQITAQGDIADDGSLVARAVTIDTAAAQPSATPAPTPSPEPSATAIPPSPEPTAAPSPAPPAPTPSPEPTAVIAAPAEPFVALRALLEAGAADRRIQARDARDLLRRLDEAERSTADGNLERAGEQLGGMVGKLSDLAGSGKVEAGFAQQVADGIGAIAGTYNIAIPEPDQKPKKPRDDDDEDD